MGIKGKIKGSYLYTQWKLGKYTKRRVKHSNINYDYDDDEMEQNYPASSNSYSYPTTSGSSYSQYSQSRSNSYNQGIVEENTSPHPGTYNRMAYYPAMGGDGQN